MPIGREIAARADRGNRERRVAGVGKSDGLRRDCCAHQLPGEYQAAWGYTGERQQCERGIELDNAIVAAVRDVEMAERVHRHASNHCKA